MCVYVCVCGLDLCPRSDSSLVFVHADVFDLLSNCTRMKPITHSGSQLLDREAGHGWPWISCRPWLLLLCLICICTAQVELCKQTQCLLRRSSIGQMLTGRVGLSAGRQLLILLPKPSLRCIFGGLFCPYVMTHSTHCTHTVSQWSPAQTRVQASWQRRNHLEVPPAFILSLLSFYH